MNILFIPGSLKNSNHVLDSVDGKKHTQTWADQDVIAERRDYIEEMLQTRKPRKIRLHQAVNFARPYECASCHGR